MFKAVLNTEYGFCKIRVQASLYTDSTEWTGFFPSFYGRDRIVRSIRVPKLVFVKRLCKGHRTQNQRTLVEEIKAGRNLLRH